MYCTLVSSCVLSLFISTVTASVLRSTRENGHHAAHDTIPKVNAVSTIYQATAEHAWIENLAVRSNGNLIFDRLDVAETWELDVTTKNASMIAAWPAEGGSLGLTEYDHDKFAVVTGNFSLQNAAASKGTWNVWSLDLSVEPPTKAIIVNIKEGLLLNGATTLRKGIVLVCDSFAGMIFSVDVEAKTYMTILDDATTKGNLSAPLGLGVNGLKVHRNWLYYTNTYLGTIFRVPISLENGEANGSPEIFANNLKALDDLFVTKSGDVYAARDPLNDLIYIPASGNSSTAIVGSLNSSTVAGVTAVQFAKGKRASGKAYLTTNGGSIAPVNGTFREPGKIVEIDLADKTW